MLRENTLFGLRDKESEALDLLRQHEPPEGYYVAYSGGKDSTVILDLVRRSGVKYDAHYNVTTVDPPELVYHIRRQADVACERPAMSMWELIPKKLMPPTRIVRYCCDVLKERGGRGRTVVTGVRAAESVRRRKRQKVEKSTDEGFKRLGCICCPMGGWRKQLQEAERWPKYKALYLMTFERLIARRLVLGKPCMWRTGADVWDWWTSPRACKDEGTASLFEEDITS